MKKLIRAESNGFDRYNKKLDLIQITIVLNTTCNYKCWYCYIPPHNKFIDADTLDDMMGILIPYIVNKNLYIVITGGEPTLHPQFLYIMRNISKYGDYIKYVDILTNGSQSPKIFEEVKSFFKLSEIGLQISLHTQHQKDKDLLISYVEFANELNRMGISYIFRILVFERPGYEVDHYKNLTYFLKNSNVKSIGFTEVWMDMYKQKNPLDFYHCSDELRQFMDEWMIDNGHNIFMKFVYDDGSVDTVNQQHMKIQPNPFRGLYCFSEKYAWLIDEFNNIRNNCMPDSVYTLKTMDKFLNNIFYSPHRRCSQEFCRCLIHTTKQDII